MYTFARLFLSLIAFFVLYQTSAQFYTVTRDESTATILTDQNEVDSISKISKNSRPLPVAPHKNESNKSGTFHPPLLSNYTITSPYGYRKDPFTMRQRFHTGIDLSANNDKVYSMTHGEITKVGFEKNGYGNYVTIQSGRFEFTYAHLKESIGSKGDYITAGTEIGISGSTGRSTGEHLHITIKNRGRTIDPYPILNYIKEKKS